MRITEEYGSRLVAMFSASPVVQVGEDYWSRYLGWRGSESFREVTEPIARQYLGADDVNYGFVRANQRVAMYPIGLLGIVRGWGMRSLTGKAFNVIIDFPLSIYSAINAVNSRDSFKYGMPMVFSEGVLDAEFLSLIYPFSFAYLTSSVPRRLAEFVSMFTNRVYIVPDADKAGLVGADKSVKKMEHYQVMVEVISMPPGYGDPGDILKMKMDGKDVSGAVAYFQSKLGNLI